MLELFKGGMGGGTLPLRSDMLRKRKFLIGGIILLLAAGYLGYTGFVSSATYYYTVTEFSQMAKPPDSVVRVGGKVAEGSVVQQGSSLRFSLVDDARSLPVAYQGAVPDTFKPGSDVVVEGKLDSSNIFEAKSILTKCASKYVPGS